MPLGMIFAMLAPYIAQWVGQSGNQPTGSSGEMDPAARRLLLGNAPGEQPTGPGFAMDTDPWLMGLIQLQARQQMRLDPLNADIVNMTRRLMPTGLQGTPTEPGSVIPPQPPNPMPGGPGSPEIPPQLPPGANPPGTAPPGSPGTAPPSGGGHPPLPADQVPRMGMGLDRGMQTLAQALSGQQNAGQGFQLPDWMNTLPSLKKRFQA